MTKVTIEVETEAYQLLKRVAKEDDSSIARICRKIVNEFIESKRSAMAMDDGTGEAGDPVSEPLPYWAKK